MDATSQRAAAHPHVYNARILITSMNSCILPFFVDFVKKGRKPHGYMAQLRRICRFLDGVKMAVFMVGNRWCEGYENEGICPK
jgi:hypothetical protein